LMRRMSKKIDILSFLFSNKEVSAFPMSSTSAQPEGFQTLVQQTASISQSISHLQSEFKDFQKNSKSIEQKRLNSFYALMRRMSKKIDILSRLLSVPLTSSPDHVSSSKNPTPAQSISQSITTNIPLDQKDSAPPLNLTIPTTVVNSTFSPTVPNAPTMSSVFLDSPALSLKSLQGHVQSVQPPAQTKITISATTSGDVSKRSVSDWISVIQFQAHCEKVFITKHQDKELRATVVNPHNHKYHLSFIYQLQSKPKIKVKFFDKYFTVRIDKPII